MPYQKTILPSHYYHDHFQEMVRFVTGLYGEMFEQREVSFINEFSKLGLNAQCLFLRMSNRKRPIFHSDDLTYSEIDDVIGALRELEQHGWARPLDEGDYKILVLALGKDMLTEALKKSGCLVFRPSWKKDRLACHILSKFTYEEFTDLCSTDRHYIPLHQETFQFLLYLYFGKNDDSLTSFTLRDLGIINPAEKLTYSARFSDMIEAKACFAYSRMTKRLKDGNVEDFVDCAESIANIPAPQSQYAKDLRDTALIRLGQYHEKIKDNSAAMALYALSESYECRERLIRLLLADGQRGPVEEMLKAMITSPSCDDEYYFATDFYARKYGRQKTSAVTDLLRAGETISVDEYFRGSAEHAALNHFKKSGWMGWHLENALWNATFGLLFWDELFEHPGALGSSFDRVPHLLRTKEFSTRYATEITSKLEALSGGKARSLIDGIYEEHFGKANGIFRWFDGIHEIVGNFISCAPAIGLITILKKMADDYFSMTDGFPDLLLIRGTSVKFVEVKGEGDQIRRTQLTRFMQLRDAGFDVEIFRVAYHVDPDQIYVVVDVETTGGRPPADRITEIGAVKIQNNRVIGEWSSLINPEKNIPSFITKLTGVSNEMVINAPLFSDIAEELMQFMDGAVFAAHNVNFDYGFIASEFRRLDISFKMPKVCTCTSMRRHYPGLASYSLGNLCAKYEVPLTEHHRALCDARAAAELLKLVNARRHIKMDRVAA